ncbi:MAG TPA: hypothetical protein VLL52_13545 [Anaerolineae bacterium]|nr:hypothetical protein [Anaerolineae bacterium]
MKETIVSYLHVLVALFSFFLLIILLTFAGTYQFLGAIVSFVPNQLNLLRTVTTDDLITIQPSADNPVSLNLTASQYYLYLDGNQSRFIISTPQNTPPSAELRFYNSPLPQGSFGGNRYAGQDFPQLPQLPAKPTAFLDINAAGTYIFQNNQPLTITIAPNYTNYNDWVIIIMTILQAAGLYGLYYAAYRWRYRQEIAQKNQQQADRRDAMDDFLNNLGK